MRVTLMCGFEGTCLSYVRLICKSKYEIFESRKRWKERDSRYVKTGAAWFTIGECISNRLDSSYPSKGEISCPKKKERKRERAKMKNR